jgi:hypothetical protein
MDFLGYSFLDIGPKYFLFQYPPGMPTLVQGLRQFESICVDWKLSQTQLVGTR